LAEPGFVSAALTFPVGPLAARVRHVVAVIDGVHRVGSLPLIPIDHRVEVPGADGQYRFNRRNGRARGIGIGRNAPSPEFVLLHEIGHFLDHQALGNRGGFASTRHPDLDDWRQAITESPTYEALSRGRRLLAFGDPSINDFQYLLDYTELWARSYAQYVALESQDPTLLRQLAAPPLGAVPYLWARWRDDDFDPVRAAIHALLRTKGWLR